MTRRLPNPAWSIRTPRLLLRSWSAADAPALKEAIDSSLDHLRPWLPWAVDEPTPLEALASRLAEFRRCFETGEDFIYAIFDAGGSRVLGGTGLHPRIGAEGLEIGYWIRVGETGAGLATETAAALSRAAFEIHGVRVVEIRCDPANAASAAVPARLGFRLAATVAGWTPRADASPQDMMIWRMRRDEYAASEAARHAVSVTDETGAAVLSTAPAPMLLQQSPAAS